MEDDEITVEEINDLMSKIEEFYKERNYPRFNMVWLADSILKRLMNDLDYYVNVEGKKGFGKSNFILLHALIQCRYSGLWKNKETGKIVKVLPRTKPLSKEWEHIKFGFQFNKNMSFFDNTDELRKKYFSLDRYMPFIIDEGSKNLHKYQWSSKLQFMLVKMSDTERYQNKSFYVCFPNFRELNSVFRNERIEMRIYIFNKNINEHYSSAIISLRDVNRHILDPWHTDENAKDYEYLLRKVPVATRGPQHILYAESKLKGYAGYFDIPDLSYLAPRIWNIYMRYKKLNAAKESADEGLEVENDSKHLRKAKESIFSLFMFLKAKYPSLTNKDLSDISGIGYQGISKLMNDIEFNQKSDDIKARIESVLMTKPIG